MSPDGRRLASGSNDGSVRLWRLAVLRGHEDAVKGVAVSPDGRRLASGGADGTVRLWDAETGGELLVLRYHELGIRDVAFTADGRRLISGSDDKTVRLLDLTGIEPFLSTSPEALLAESEQRTGLRVVDLDVVPIPQNRLLPPGGD